MLLTGVTVGFLDPKSGAEHDFNRWYDLDHIPENTALTGHVGARRYIAGREDIELRPPARLREFAEGKGAYCSVYLLTGNDLVLTRSTMHDLARRLNSKGRMFAMVHAHNVHTWAVQQVFSSPGLRLAPAAIPYIGHSGIYMVMIDAPSNGPDADHARLSRHIRNELKATGSIAAVHLTRILPEEDGRVMIMYYLGKDPHLCGKEFSERITSWNGEHNTSNSEGADIGARILYAGGYQLISPLSDSKLTE